MRPSFPSKQRRVMSNNTPPSLRPTGSMPPLFQDEFHGTLPSTKTQACGRSELSAQPTPTLLTNHKVVIPVTGARISLSIPRVTADWHGNADVLKSCLARPYGTFQHNNCMEISSPDDGDMSKAMRLPAMAEPLQNVDERRELLLGHFVVERASCTSLAPFPAIFFVCLLSSLAPVNEAVTIRTLTPAGMVMKLL
ncbi:hypothetical protein EV421DRAFT_2024457 [Armillaria borealis]|uniref:Uncharacterized protein n=1 Tax=Armillaria borealis TaxID=47425 RepID=A0AA39IW72_9AGAR|nr:hypothetical protein EV421DRAFT_2024457 [Armillaria borealis]